jgi:basic membrane protein A
MRTMFRSLSTVAAVAMLATACSAAPDTASTEDPSPDTTAPTEASTTDTPAALRACQVTDTGGVDDRSFNQTAYDGILQAESELGVDGAVLESTSDADYAPNIAQFISDGCDIIVTVGFLLDGATQDAAKANPDQDFAIIDVDFAEFDADGSYVGDIVYDNVRELNFATDQAAFLAGYVAAATSETGKVGTYGGIPIPPVTIFMNGFLAGVRYHNQETGSSVEVLGWDGTDGSFTGNFESQDDGRNLTDQLIASGADVIMPVAGPVGLGTIAAVEDANDTGSSVSVIWVDTDGRVTVPQSADVFLTSVQKNMDIAVLESVRLKVDGMFEGGPYVGTLANEGVGITTDSLDGDLASKIAELTAGIIAGEISVLPADYS